MAFYIPIKNGISLAANSYQKLVNFGAPRGEGGEGGGATYKYIDSINPKGQISSFITPKSKI